MITRIIIICLNFSQNGLPSAAGTPEEGLRTHRPKCSQYNNENEDSSPNILRDRITAFKVQIFEILTLCKSISWQYLSWFLCLIAHQHSWVTSYQSLTQPAEPVEYTDYLSDVGLDFPNECSDMTQKSESVPSVILEIWRMQSAPGLPSIPGPLWPRSGSIW